MDDPAADGYYNIGVYVYSGNTSTYATVRVYLDGILSWEHPDRFLSACSSFSGGCELWQPANINWANRQVIPIDAVQIIDIH